MISAFAISSIVIACVFAHGFFVSAEVALSACDRQALRQRAAAGGSRAVRIERMVAVPQVTLATTLVGANLATMIAVIVVALQLDFRDISPLWAPLIAMPPMLVIGHLVPKAVVQAHADALVDRFATSLRLASYLLRPLVVVVGGFAALLTRAMRTDSKKAFVTRDELALLIESEPQTDKPEISADEREMIANVFDLSAYTVGELMVPLSEVTALPEDSQIAEAALEVADKQHSRMPLYRSRVDDVVGIVHVFDLLQAAGTGKAAGRAVSELAHPPSYVPEKMKASDLLVQLQTEQQHLAIVVDEYGGAVGIVTIEDLLEIIVGDIEDEYDHEPSPIKVERPGIWRVEARTSVARVNAELDIGLPESNEDYETIAGLLIEKLRRIPDKGEIISLAGLSIEIVAATDRAIESVRITKKKK